MKLKPDNKGPSFGAPGFSGRYCSTCQYCVYSSAGSVSKVCCNTQSEKYRKTLSSTEGACIKHIYGKPIVDHL